MAYKIMYGDELLYDSYTDSWVSDATLTASVNTPGYFDFTIHPGSPLIDRIEEKKETVRLYFDDEVLFDGYVESISTDIYGSKDISCTSALSYLGWTIVRPYSTDPDPESNVEFLEPPTNTDAFFEWLIDQHNKAALYSWMQFQIGVNQGGFLENEVIPFRESTSCPTTAQAIEDEVLSYGGYLFLRYDGGARVLDLYSDVHDDNTQIIDFGVNLIDFVKTSATDNQYTAVRPLGGNPEVEVEDDKGNKQTVTLPAITLDDVPDGAVANESDYVKRGDVVYCDSAVSRYGYRETTYSNSDVVDPDILLRMAVADLKKKVSPSVTIEAKAVDLALYMEGYTHLQCGQAVRIRSRMHDLDMFLMVESIDLDLLNPSATTYTLGTSFDTLTGEQSAYLKRMTGQINSAVDKVASIDQAAKDAADAAKDAITDSKAEFYQSTSPTELLGGRWGEVNVWQQGKYTWTRTFVTYGDGRTAYLPDETGVCISGNTGDPGAPGLPGEPGIDGRTSYFHVKYSPVENPTASQMTETPDKYIGTYVSFNKNDSTDPDDYTWSQFQGDPGATGIPGVNGADGRTSYLHIAYANSADGTSGFSVSDSKDKLYIGQYTDFNVADSTSPSSYSWTKIKGDQGPKGDQGIQGLQGPKGDQGIPGTNGVNGQTSYFHIKYAPVQNPTASQMTETPDKFIGTYVDFNAADSTDPSKYTWAQFEGSQGSKGDQGIPGTNGLDGKTSYLHIAYANSADGTSGFSVSDSTNKLYIGQYTDFNVADSTSPSSYSWTKIKGDQGAQGPQGATGATGPQGPQGPTGATGATGVSVTSVTEYYLATSASSGVTQSTSGWTTSIQATDTVKRYLWNYERINFSDGTNQTTDPVIIGTHGATGATGPAGAAGKGIKSIVEWYLVTSASTGVTPSTSGWKTTPEATTATNRYLWNYEIVTYTDNTTTQTTPAIIGTHGATGAQGPTGATGSTGKGLVSVVDEWYVSTSSTAQQGGSWSTTFPTIPSGKYLWHRQRMTWSDNTVTYTNATVSQWVTKTDFQQTTDSIKLTAEGALQKVDNLSIGGEQLLTGTRDFTGQLTPKNGATTGDSETYPGFKYIQYQKSPTMSYIDPIMMGSVVTPFPRDGETFTLSFNARAVAGTATVYCYLWADKYTGDQSVANTAKEAVTSQGKTSASSDGSISFDLDDTSRRYWVTWTYRADATKSPSLCIGRWLTSDTGTAKTVSMNRIKFERGNVATDWSPSPGDNDVKYSTKAELKVEADRISGVVQQTGELGEKVSKVEQTADGLTVKLENLSVGGTNLLLASANSYDRVTASRNIGGIQKTAVPDARGGNDGVRFKTPTADTANGWGIMAYRMLGDNIDLIEPSTEYTASFDIKPSIQPAPFACTLMESDATNRISEWSAKVSPPAGVWTHLAMTFETLPDVSAKSVNTCLYFDMRKTLSSICEIEVCNFKLEKGSLATDWSPAPQDVEDGIDGAKKVATNYMRFDDSGLAIGDMTGSSLGKNVLIDSDSVDIRNGTTTLASFQADRVELAKNDALATIDMCGGIASIEGWVSSDGTDREMRIYGQDGVDIRVANSGENHPYVRLGENTRAGWTFGVQASNIYFSPPGQSAADDVQYSSNMATFVNLLNSLPGWYTARVVSNLNTLWYPCLFAWTTSTVGIPVANSYGMGICIANQRDDSSSNWVYQIGKTTVDSSDIWVRQSINTAGWTAWRRVGAPSDSGWQTIAVSGGNTPIRYRKIGSTVYLRCKFLPAGTSDWKVLCTLPAGYRPDEEIIGALAYQGSGTHNGELRVKASGELASYGDTANTYWSGILTYFV